jgi:hypothetical protein
MVTRDDARTVSVCGERVATPATRTDESSKEV